MDLSSKILNRVRGVDHGKSMKNDVVNKGNEKKGNKFMDKFFFGYLSLKWRRLVRTIFVLIISIVFFYVLAYFINYGFIHKGEDQIAVFFLMGSIALPILISYLVEPFVRKQH